MNYGILYSGFPFTLEGYYDDLDLCVCVHLRWWCSIIQISYQTIIARSTMESALVALDLAKSVVEWLRYFLVNIPLINDVLPPVSMHCDCQATIAILKNKSYNCKSKHTNMILLISC